MRETEKSPSGRSAGACPSFSRFEAPTRTSATAGAPWARSRCAREAPALAADPFSSPAVPASLWCLPGAVSTAARGRGAGIPAGGGPGGVSIPSQPQAAGGRRRAEGGASEHTLPL